MKQLKKINNKFFTFTSKRKILSSFIEFKNDAVSVGLILTDPVLILFYLSYKHILQALLQF